MTCVSPEVGSAEVVHSEEGYSVRGDEPLKGGHGPSKDPGIFSNAALAAMPTAEELLAATEHAIGCRCGVCFWIRRNGPKPPTNSLLRFYGKSEGSAAVVPAKDKRKLRNESRRISRLRARRNREKRALVALLRGEG